MRAPSSRRAIAIALVIAVGWLTVQPSAAATNPPRNEWTNLGSVKIGGYVSVEPIAKTDKKVGGKLIAFDETSLTILVGKADRRIPRDEIRKVKTFRQSLGVGLWIAVVGSCIQLGTNIWALRAPEGEIRNPGQLGTALALAGLVVALAPGLSRTIYERPRGEPAGASGVATRTEPIGRK